MSACIQWVLCRAHVCVRVCVRAWQMSQKVNLKLSVWWEGFSDEPRGKTVVVCTCCLYRHTNEMKKCIDGKTKFDMLWTVFRNDGKNRRKRITVDFIFVRDVKVSPVQWRRLVYDRKAWIRILFIFCNVLIVILLLDVVVFFMYIFYSCAITFPIDW